MSENELRPYTEICSNKFVYYLENIVAIKYNY